ncbi:MAG: tetratricopeptide repeat protein [Candidatus Omnitrophica bacterium]|nr:tetratricopeptide repeat protein [Candidatus Omnitrophota bacterium]
MCRRRVCVLIVLFLLFLSWSIPLYAEESFFSEEVKEYRKAGYKAYREGNLDKAYQFFKKAVLLDPENSLLHNDLGIVYERRGLKELAIKEYLEAIRINPQYPAPYMNLALLYRELGEIEKVIFYLKERVKLGKSRDPWYKKALAMLKSYEENVLFVEEKNEEPMVVAGEELLNKTPKTFLLEKDEKMRREETFETNEVNEVEKIYQEGKNALSGGNFGLAVEKINQLLMLNPLYKATEEVLINVEKDRLMQETREEEPIVLYIP